MLGLKVFALMIPTDLFTIHAGITVLISLRKKDITVKLTKKVKVSLKTI